MKFIKFILSSKDSVTMPMDKAERLIDSSEQIVKITDETGHWTGEVVNKAHIVTTKRDYEKEREYKAYDQGNPALPEPKQEPLDPEKYKPDFLKGREEFTKDPTPPEKLKAVEKQLKTNKK